MWADTNITELADDIRIEEQLSVSRSLVTHLPNLKAKNLDLTNSKVTSVGCLEIEQYIFADSTDAFTHKIKCGMLQLYTDRHTDFDLFHVDAMHVILSGSGEFNLKNCKAISLSTHDFESIKQARVKHITLAQSEFTDITIKAATGTVSLGLDSSVSASHLNLVPTEEADFSVLIDRAAIDCVHIDNDIGSYTATIRFNSLILYGDFQVSQYLTLVLPSFGIVYGNMEVHSSHKLPPSFSCVGNVVYSA